MTIFGRNRNKKLNEREYISSPSDPDVSDYPSNYRNKGLPSYNPSLDNGQYNEEQNSPEKKIKTPKYQIICLPLDTRSGRVLLVTKADDTNIWVLPKAEDAEMPQPETTAHAIAANIVGVEGRLISHIGEFTQTGKKKRVKAYVNAYEFQVTSIMSEYEFRESRGRRWFTYVEAMQILGDKPFQQNILRRTSIAPKF